MYVTRPMSEMLGNQYFLARKYDLAIETFKKVLIKEPENNKVLCKLVICYTQTGKIQKALEIFTSLLKEDIDIIINRDPIKDDCPCPEIVYELEAQVAENQDSLDFFLVSGMLWLYCDLNKSLQYFKRAQDLAKNDTNLKYIIMKLTSQLEEENVGRVQSSL